MNKPKLKFTQKELGQIRAALVSGIGGALNLYDASEQEPEVQYVWADVLDAQRSALSKLNNYFAEVEG